MISRPGSSWPAARVLLDVDGVLLDTRVTTRSAWRWWAERAGTDPDEATLRARGRRAADIVTELAPDRDVAVELADLEERFLTLVRGTQRVAGAAGFVRALPQGRWAVVSSASPAVTTAHLRRARISAPATVVTAGSTAAGRPDPQPHLAALSELRPATGPCVAIESSAAGIVAAKEAGCTVVAITPTVDTAALPGADGYVHGIGALRVRLVADGLVLSVGRDIPRQS